MNRMVTVMAKLVTVVIRGTGRGVRRLSPMQHTMMMSRREQQFSSGQARYALLS